MVRAYDIHYFINNLYTNHSDINSEKEDIINILKLYTMKKLNMHPDNFNKYSLEELVTILNLKMKNELEKKEVFKHYFKALLSISEKMQETEIKRYNHHDKNIGNKMLVIFSELGILENITLYNDIDYYNAFIMALDLFQNSLMEETDKVIILK